jgi:hypothetical protein
MISLAAVAEDVSATLKHMVAVARQILGSSEIESGRPAGRALHASGLDVSEADGRGSRDDRGCRTGSEDGR